MGGKFISHDGNLNYEGYFEKISHMEKVLKLLTVRKDMRVILLVVRKKILKENNMLKVSTHMKEALKTIFMMVKVCISMRMAHLEAIMDNGVMVSFPDVVLTYSKTVMFTKVNI